MQVPPAMSAAASASAASAATAAVSAATSAGAAKGVSPIPFPNLNEYLNQPSSSAESMKVGKVSKKKRAKSPIELTANKRNVAEKALALGSKKGKKTARFPQSIPTAVSWFYNLIY